MSGLFHVGQGTCLCATNPGDGYGRKGQVLYCYGEVRQMINQMLSLIHI